MLDWRRIVLSLRECVLFQLKLLSFCQQSLSLVNLFMCFLFSRMLLPTLMFCQLKIVQRRLSIYLSNSNDGEESQKPHQKKRDGPVGPDLQNRKCQISFFSLAFRESSLDLVAEHSNHSAQELSRDEKRGEMEVYERSVCMWMLSESVDDEV